MTTPNYWRLRGECGCLDRIRRRPADGIFQSNSQSNVAGNVAVPIHRDR